MKVLPFTVGAFQENSYLLVDDAAAKCVFIDPGAEPRRLTNAVEAESAVLQAIWLTHAHVDHLGAVAGILARWDVPVYLHPADGALFSIAERQAAMYGVAFEQPPMPSHALAEGDTLRVGNLAFDVIHCPGHAPGHVVIHGHGIAFAGDCLFAGSIGRTDLPFSNPSEMSRSLARIAALPDETIVYSGHGPSTTIGEEKRSNPFLNGMARVVGG